ncbi:extracellular catalytic domain type 1 short-chain-length polyhydroxyalkanoate depolymerase [Wenxinia marina]|uniref:Esterase, PHB depolymerase family n=1 Tax=Wenxinia marina DSM 24838 TaxID=1123501 RepID=A0A0D0QK00_9RHOB|nr:PHB depolymerase family esterase [Wenxinia marina]KIQ71333.1 esterase, PHB depolymerase family [Wenxinia marina DSM 24838]GGL73973.1 poly(3-hydroxybutyrate) depolymerase [Wenxinia marina]
MDDFRETMRRSLQMTRAGDPAGATKLIQDSLRRSRSDVRAEPSVEPLAAPKGAPRRPAAAAPGGPVEDAEILEVTPPKVSPATGRPARARRAGGGPGLAAPPGARFERRRHTCVHGARDYLLYTPSGPVTGALVMLHGCTQSAEDFARGTAMNAAAETAGFVVIWPEQGRGDNASLCWNWFRGEDQAATGGEPALLADLARSVARDTGIPDGRVFAAGLSAGGAMAAILGQTHPDLFGAVGVHSGLAPCSARDVMSAFGAMRGDAAPGARALTLPCIVFQGLSDQTVAPVNAQRVTGPLSDTRTCAHSGAARSARVTTGRNAAGSAVELWEIDGAGHAWSGGATTGSYTDPKGPDASVEMIRFFLAQARARAGD